MHQIEALHTTGFLEIEHTHEEAEDRQRVRYVPPDLNGRFIVTDQWRKMQDAFGIGLTDVANIAHQGSMVVRPVFRRPDSHEPLDLFVLMPFAEQFEPVYQDHILKVSTELGLSTKRADEFSASVFIVQEIWNSINNAALILADCSDRNPNVFYELGIAHTVGKHTIIVSRDDAVPFDINHIRFIKYKYTPRGMTTFEDTLRDYLSYLIKRIPGRHGAQT